MTRDGLANADEAPNNGLRRRELEVGADRARYCGGADGWSEARLT
jgi:hypothetical protein